MEHRPLPIGVDNFERVISEGYYYIDKTLLIKDLIDNKSMVSLFTRPRRFGKTLNLSMLRYYFEKSEKDCRHLFKGLKISQAGEKYAAEQGKYPVIMLNLKSGKQPDFDLAYTMLKRNIMGEFKRHRNILEKGLLDKEEESRYIGLMENTADDGDFADAAKFLSECLEKVYGEKAVILIDEYDVPLENAYYAGFYDKMIGFIRSLFESALKTNDSLAFAVITGCLRISRESIFTGLNNLEIISIRNVRYGEYFGFLQVEVEEMLRYYGRAHHIETVKEWYDGYSFGQEDVYNPWSLINYTAIAVADDKAFPQPYWSNTSSNSIIKDLIDHADIITKNEIEKLIEGGSIEKPVHEDITYEDIHKSRDNLWNFLFFTGYLKRTGERMAGEIIYMTMEIPNREVRYIYANSIMRWFDDNIAVKSFGSLYEATLSGDTGKMEEEISSVLMESLSYYDSSESFYHGFMLGIYKNMGYIAESNVELGKGRPDLVVRYLSMKGKAIIFEFKATKDPFAMEECCEKALNQIREKEYIRGIQAKGYQDIFAYGIAFCGKDCIVKML